MICYMCTILSGPGPQMLLRLTAYLNPGPRRFSLFIYSFRFDRLSIIWLHFIHSPDMSSNNGSKEIQFEIKLLEI